MPVRSLLGRWLAVMSVISALSIIGYIASIKMQQKTIGHRGSIQSSETKRSVIESLIIDGFQPIALTPTCQYKTQLNIQRTTQIPSPPWNTNGTRLTIGPTSTATAAAAVTASSYSASRLPGKAPPIFCQEKRLSSQQQSTLVVPNVVHYVFIGSDFEFRFITHMSLLSVHRFLQPDQIFIHGDVLPSGRWWTETVNQLVNVYHVRRNYSQLAPNGKPFKCKAHISDYIRADILACYGGIYLDPDVLVLKSFDPLRHHSFVLGRESEDGICNGVILSRPRAPFLRLLLEQYWSYTGPNEKWAMLSVYNVHKLALIYRHLIHIEEESLNRPNWKAVAQIYNGDYNWRNGSYTIHLWLRLWPKEKVPLNWEELARVNTTIGQIARHIRQPS